MRLTAVIASSMALAVLAGASACATAELADHGLRGNDPAGAAPTPPAAAPPGAALPDIAALEPPQPAPRTSSFTEDGLRRDGAQFEAALPHNRVTPAAPLAVFSPAFAAGDSGPEPAAYAIYRLDVAGYDREPELRLTWDSPPADGTLFIGLANFASGRWVWFEPVASTTLNLGAVAAYHSPGDFLYAAVVVLGDQPAALASLRLGLPRPLAALSADPLSGVVPLAVTFDAGGSTAPDSELTLYEWDFDGDGTYEADSAGDPGTVHEYAEGGEFQAAVRVTNSFGFTATASVVVSTTATWRHTAGGPADDYDYAIAVDNDGNVYTAGTSVAENERLLLCKWDKAGNLVWGRVWSDGADDAVARDLALDAEGNPVVCGSLFYYHPVDYEFNAVLLKFTSAGDLSWARRYNGAEDDTFEEVCVDGTDIYVAGETDSLGTDTDVLLLRCGGDGNLIWSRRYEWLDETVGGARLLITPGGVTALYVVMTEFNDGVNPDDTFPLWVRYSLDGEFEVDGCFLNSNKIRATGLELDYEPLTMQTTIYIVGEEVPPATRNIVVMATTPDRSDLFCRRFDDEVNGSYPHSIELDPGAGLLVAGHSDYDAALWRFDASDGTVLGAERFVNGESDSELFEAVWRDGRLYACGYGGDVQGTWESLSAGQSSLPRNWLFGGGQSHNEDLTLDDPLTDSVADWEPPVIDTGGGLYDTLVTWRAAP